MFYGTIIKIMNLFHHYHQNKLQRWIHSDFWLFEFSVWLFTFSRSMVAVFIPIFLLEIGYSIEEIILFYFIFNIFNVPLNFIARWMVRKFGAKMVVIVGSLFSAAFFVGLFSLDINNWFLLILIAFFAAIYDAFYWVSHLYLFMKCSHHKENISGDTSVLQITRRVAGILAPALGAAILIFFDKKALIFISIVISVLSVLPLLKIKDISDKPYRKQKNFKRFFKNWDIVKDYLSVGFYNVHVTVEGVIWPLFIYLFFSNIRSVAVLPVIVSLTTIIFMYFAGKITKEKRSKMIAIGSILIAFVWIMRLFVDNGIFYYVSVFMIGLFSILISVPVDSSIFEKGEDRDRLSASMWRNVFCMSSNVVLFGFLSLVVNIFQVSFILAVFSMLVVIMVSYLIGELFLIKHK